jgi:hypothetical protein
LAALRVDQAHTTILPPGEERSDLGALAALPEVV